MLYPVELQPQEPKTEGSILFPRRKIKGGHADAANPRISALYADVSCGTSIGMPKQTKHIAPVSASQTPKASAALNAKQALLSASPLSNGLRPISRK